MGAYRCLALTGHCNEPLYINSQTWHIYGIQPEMCNGEGGLKKSEEKKRKRWNYEILNTK